MDDVVAASLQAFCERGGGVLPYPGSDVPALELWYASNRASSAREPQGPRLLRALGGLAQPSQWKGRYSKQVLISLWVPSVGCVGAASVTRFRLVLVTL